MKYIDTVRKLIEKWKYLINPILFMTILIFFLITLSYWLRPNDDRKEAFAGFYAEEEESLDVVMIGSSPVYPYFAAPLMWHETGITSYALSTSSQRPDAMLYLIKEAEKTQSSALIILEMRMFRYDMSQFDTEEQYFYNRTLTDNLRYSWNRMELINQTTKENVSLADYLDIIRYHDNWKTQLGRKLNYYDYRVQTPYKGFIFVPNIEQLRVEASDMVNEVTAIPEDTEEIYIEIMDYCQRENLNVLFLLSPFLATKEDKQKFNYMKKLTEDRGFEFLDMNEHYDEIGLDFNLDFYNAGHVNISGAEKCTSFLGKYLKDNFTFNANHKELVVNGWNQSWEQWNKEAEVARKTWEENKNNIN